MITSSADTGQTPFFITHLKMLTPTLRELTEAVLEVESEIIAVPETSRQAEVPTRGLFAANTIEPEQTA
jgi:hypothetical protein